MADREYTLKFIGDIANVEKSLGNLEKDVSGLKGGMSTFAKAVGAAFALDKIVDFGKGIANAASDQEQALGASSSVFKEYAGEIQAFGKTTAENLGISEAAFNQLATTTGALLKNAGVPLDETTDATISLTERAADMAAMFGGDVSEALSAINSGLKGELDPLERFGVSLKASAVDARAAAMGYVDSEGKVTDYGRSMARVALIMEQTADAQGTAAREADTMAGTTMRLKAQFTDLQADLGQKLLPLIVKFAEVLRGLITFVTANQGWLLPLVAGITAIALGFKAWTLATQAWEAATKIATAVQWLFNAAMTANPIGLIVAAIAAVVAAVVLLYTKVDWFRAGVDAAIDGIVSAFQWLWDKIQAVFGWVRDNWPLLLAIITGPIGIAIHQVITHWDTIKGAVQSVINWVRNNWQLIVGIITGPIGAAVAIVVTNWDKIKSAASTAVSAIKGFVSGLADVISYPFKQAASAIGTAWDGVKRLFSGAWSFINNALSGIAAVIRYPFEQAFNAIKNLWNNTVGRLSFTVPSWVPGIGGKGWSAPRLAAGGIVTRPTIALIGEAGPEAVVPLDGNHGIGGNVTINVYALTASAEVGKQVYASLREYERISGRAI